MRKEKPLRTIISGSGLITADTVRQNAENLLRVTQPLKEFKGLHKEFNIKSGYEKLAKVKEKYAKQG
jgi:hypothetical protein